MPDRREVVGCDRSAAYAGAAIIGRLRAANNKRLRSADRSAIY
jgi:hypothetical protein